MLAELLAIMAPLFIGTAIGYGWVHSGKDYPSEFVSRAVMNIATPCLIVSVMSRVEVEPRIMGGVALAAALVTLSMLVIGYLVTRWLRLEPAGYLPSLLFPNNGNLGLPLCLFAFGETGLALALASFMVMMLSTFTLGIVMVSRAEGIGARLRALARQPVLYAMVLAVALLLTDTELPRWLFNTTDLLGGFAIPLMIMTLGVSLARLKLVAWKRSLLFSALRVLGGLALGYLAARLVGLEGEALGVAVLQAAMPVAIFNYLLSLRYDRQPQEVAAMVLISTLLAFLVLPMVLVWVLPLAGT
ncbi:AEC family transporter [Marinimicrobium sp. ARAG 43.8]|uniref:AEC family transporter n=1 Tax=Marinimicrobium sp. ARAG 43.8 TaxID=3418719 RepID=UPI003CF4FC90